MPPIITRPPQTDEWFTQFESVPEPGLVDQVAANAAAQSQPGPVLNQVTQFAADVNDPQAYFNSLFPGDTLSPQQLMAAKDQLASRGIKVLTNASGISAKIQLPNGQIIDVIQGAGAGMNKKQWLTGEGGGGGNALGQLGYGFGSSMAPWTENFTAPNAEQAANTPGVQFALGEVNRLGQSSMAARGILGNARAQEQLSKNLLGTAMGYYGDIYDRSLGEYGLRRDNFFQNQDRPFSKNMQLAQLGMPR